MPLERSLVMQRSRRSNLTVSQNFLHSSRLTECLVAMTGVGPNDFVIEIGAGKGIITAALARRCRHVVAIEKDPLLAAGLERRFAGEPRVSISGSDALQTPLPKEPYKVVANIPFNLTADIVTRLTTAPNTPDDIYLVVQREAAERFMGQPRGTLFAALLHPWFNVSVVYRFRPTDFAPPPAVETVLMRMRKRGPPLIEQRNRALYHDLVAYLFTAWQPTIRHALEKALGRPTVRRIERSTVIALDAPPSHLLPDHWTELFTCCQAAWPRIRTQLAGTEARLRREQACLTKRHRSRSAGRIRDMPSGS
jgi:23S rRNA (adenine-N6)-dimethyltransferase